MSDNWAKQSEFNETTLDNFRTLHDSMNTMTRIQEQLMTKIEQLTSEVAELRGVISRRS